MYKQDRTFDERCRESKAMLIKYPDRIPVIVHPKGTSTPQIDKRKYMSPRALTFSQLFYVIRKRLRMDSTKALFFFLENNALIVASSQVSDIYERHADEDGFLYIFYSLENTFG